jgi:para-nitrobenzyl esterase
MSTGDLMRRLSIYGSYCPKLNGSRSDVGLRGPAALTNAFIALGGWRWAEAQSKTGQSPVYRYRLDRPAPPEENHPQGKYAFHSDELEYVFGTLDVRRGAVWHPEDRVLSDEIVTYWTNFARTGNPNRKGLPEWPRYDKEQKVIHLDSPITVMLDNTQAEFKFLISNKARP